MLDVLLHRCCEARIDLRRKKKGPYFLKGSIHILTVCIFGGAIAIAHGDRDDRCRDAINGVRRAA